MPRELTEDEQSVSRGIGLLRELAKAALLSGKTPKMAEGNIPGVREDAKPMKSPRKKQNEGAE